jgi:hypothetical protein
LTPYGEGFKIHPFGNSVKFAKNFVFEFFMPLIEEPVDRLLALLLGGHALPVASQAELHTHLATTRGRSRIARALSQRRQGARLPDVAFAQLCGMLDFTMTHAGIAHGKFLVPPPRSPPVSRSDPSDNDDGHVGSSADTAAAGAGADASVSNSQLFLATDAPAEPEPDWDDPAVAYWEDVRTLRSLLTMSGTFELDHAGPSGNADAAARYENDRNTKNEERWRKKKKNLIAPQRALTFQTKTLTSRTQQRRSAARARACGQSHTAAPRVAQCGSLVLRAR